MIGDQLDSVARPRLENDLQRRLRIDVVKLDGFTDSATHKYGHSLLSKALLQKTRFFEIVQHNGHMMKSLTVLL